MQALKKTSILALALLVAACGGGGGSGSASPSGPATGGIQGSGIVFGSITGFGSIFVNGVEWRTSGAQFTIDGQSGGREDQLRIGKVVTVRGTLDAGGTSGSASTVDYADSVEGPIASIDRATGSFVVLGQTIRVTGSTRFDDSVSPRSFDGLSVGLIVEVSGFVDAAGAVVATHIERKTAGAPFEVTGAVSNLSTANSTFSINALVVDYAAATVTNGTLANGATVEVKGSTILGNGALRASSVEVKGGLGARNGDQIEIEGYVTRYSSNGDFDVNAQRVSTDSSTQFVLNGLTLALNVKVEVEGSINASSVLVARKVELKRDNSTRILATIESITAPSTLRLLGVNVSTEAGTQYEDKSSAGVRTLGFSALRTGDYVEVRGFEGATAGTMTATILERDDLETRRELRAVARNPADPNVTLLGQTISLAGVTEFRDLAGNPITRVQFFAALSGGSQSIEIRGTAAGGTVSWTRAELEN
jgi:hypothetical protein